MPTKVTYQTLTAELEDVLAQLQQPGVQVDEAVRLYEQGLKLVAAIEKYLQQAENKIIQLKLQTDAGEPAV